MTINEELRQQLGELLGAKLYSTSHDGLGNFEHVDWTNPDNVDEVIAATALLALRPYISTEQARKYDRTHKRMRAITRDWNRIEHQRGVK